MVDRRERVFVRLRPVVSAHVENPEERLVEQRYVRLSTASAEQDRRHLVKTGSGCWEVRLPIIWNLIPSTDKS